MSREVALPYGGDFSLDSSGDLVIVDDDGGQWAALQQRVIQMLLTCPQIVDEGNNPVPRSADDIFHTSAGAGLPRAIGNLTNNALLAQIESRVMDGLSSDPDVAQSPAPSLDFTIYPNGVSATLTLSAIDGQVMVLGPIPVTPSGA